MLAVEGADLADTYRPLTTPPLASLAAELAGIDALGGHERDALVTGTADALVNLLQRKLTRLLLLELQAARADGRLTAADSAGRWDEFVHLASTPDFWRQADQDYPGLTSRVAVQLERRCQATAELGRRFAADRHAIGNFIGMADPELVTAQFGRGDSHRGGRSVVTVDLAGTKLMYKPRRLDIDLALEGLLAAVLPDRSSPRIRVPRVLLRASYGWAEFVEHRYCESDSELSAYYTGLGHWLAIARLVAASDLHAENLIACGPTPVVVDCETLFTPRLPTPPSGLGAAADAAAELLAISVMRSGLLPGRGGGLGWRGIDVSAAGALPGEQPVATAPQLLDAGTDRARIGSGPLPMSRAANLPAAEPRLREHWPAVLAGFDALSGRLRDLDATDRLTGLLAAFEQVETRYVLRATEVYAELSRMLWHPASQHNLPAAEAAARDLLRRQSERITVRPPSEQLIAAEVADLLNGDVPYFSGRPGDGQLTGPGGHRLAVPGNRIGLALEQWRATDLATERTFVQATLVSAYLNDEPPSARPAVGRIPVAGSVEHRRRRLAADLVEQLIRGAIFGGDGTVTWIAPTLTEVGWSVQPLGADAYSGLAGVAVALAAYQHEAVAGRAEPVAGVAPTLQAVLAGLRLAEQVRRQDRQQLTGARPEAPGLYLGLGSRVWTWLLLHQLDAVGEEGVAQAIELATLIPAAAAASPEVDLLGGTAGGLVATLQVAEFTGDDTWLTQAIGLAELIDQRAVLSTGGGRRWPAPRASEGLGGFAHGATGIGWALARLAAATDDSRWAALATGAFRFEEQLYDPDAGGWLDLRGLGGPPTAAAWCHGSVGIGLAALDLATSGQTGAEPDAAESAAAGHREVVRRAVRLSRQRGFSAGAGLCHGAAGAWELLATAGSHGLPPDDLDAAQLAALTLASIEQDDRIYGATSGSVNPALMSGVSGVVYQLLRMHPLASLPSVLVPRC